MGTHSSVNLAQGTGARDASETMPYAACHHWQQINADQPRAGKFIV